MEKIELNKEIYFYDDRNKSDYMFKLTKVLYQDDEICLCLVKSTEPKSEYEENLLFNLEDGSVKNEDYSSWYATNDVGWAKEEDERLRKRAEM